MPAVASSRSSAAGAGISRPRRISPMSCAASATAGAVETLAIIAYHEPVSRAEIEAVRGVQTSKGTIDVLMEAGWIRPAGRREVPGRPIVYATTPEFLDHFGLANRRDLPGIDDLAAAGLLDPDEVLPEREIDDVEQPEEADEEAEHVEEVDNVESFDDRP